MNFLKVFLTIFHNQIILIHSQVTYSIKFFGPDARFPIVLKDPTLAKDNFDLKTFWFKHGCKCFLNNSNETFFLKAKHPNGQDLIIKKYLSDINILDHYEPRYFYKELKTPIKFLPASRDIQTHFYDYNIEEPYYNGEYDYYKFGDPKLMYKGQVESQSEFKELSVDKKLVYTLIYFDSFDIMIIESGKEEDLLEISCKLHLIIPDSMSREYFLGMENELKRLVLIELIIFPHENIYQHKNLIVQKMINRRERYSSETILNDYEVKVGPYRIEKRSIQSLTVRCKLVLKDEDLNNIFKKEIQKAI